MHIDAIRVKNEVEKEDIRVTLKLFEGCLMAALTFGAKTW